MVQSLSGKKFVIAGYGEPLGEALARILVTEGGIPILVARSSDRLKKAVEKIKGSIYFVCDLSTDNGRLSLKEHIKDSIGKVDGLVITLGGFFIDRYDDLGNTLSLMDTNMLLPLSIINALHAVINEFGSIVFTTSTQTLVFTDKTPLSYAASKYALNGLTSILAAQLVSQNIRVNGVAISSISEKYEPGRDWKKLRKMGQDETPPEDIANVIYFLLSDLSEMVDGIIIPADGGHRFRS